MNDDNYKSRTQKKNEDRALQKLGEELIKLSSEQLGRIDIPEEIFEAVELIKKISSHGARRRQIQFLGSLMRKIDSAVIENALGKIQFGDSGKACDYKTVEKWRNDLLVADNNDFVNEIIAEYPGAERQRLMQLVRNARKESEKGKERVKSSKALFKYLRDIYENKA